MAHAFRGTGQEYTNIAYALPKLRVQAQRANGTYPVTQLVY